MVRTLAILTSLAAGLLLTAAADARSLSRGRHVVVAGDTLHDLARRYGCSVADLRRGNDVTELLPIGKVLRLRPPCKQRASEARVDRRAHHAEPERRRGRATLAATRPVPPASSRRTDPGRKAAAPAAQAVARAEARAEARADVVAIEVPREALDPPPSDLPVTVAAPADAPIVAPSQLPPEDDGEGPRDEGHVVLDERALAALSPSVGEEPVGQSVGLPWRGRLVAASKLASGEGYLLRRPHRAFGTATTVRHVAEVLGKLRRAFPELHDLAIGDLSAEHGGPISDHRSHQSGRDIDIGLLFSTKPAGYPATFVTGTEDTLHLAASWELLSLLADTAGSDGGVTLILLDYELQGAIYRWAQTEGVDREVLDKMFQYPRGKRAGVGLVRHAPNHADHFHVRFGCAADDASCRSSH